MLTLKLHHCPNPDIPSGYYETPVDPAEMTIEVNSVADASREYRKWIDRNGLGGGNCSVSSGRLLTVEGQRDAYAFVSYNGNVWLADCGRKLYDVKWQMAETNCAPDGWKWA